MISTCHQWWMMLQQDYLDHYFYNNCNTTNTQPTTTNWDILSISPAPTWGNWLVTHAESCGSRILGSFWSSFMTHPLISNCWHLRILLDRNHNDSYTCAHCFGFFLHRVFATIHLRTDQMTSLSHRISLFVQTTSSDFSTYMLSEVHDTCWKKMANIITSLRLNPCPLRSTRTVDIRSSHAPTENCEKGQGSGILAE